MVEGLFVLVLVLYSSATPVHLKPLPVVVDCHDVGSDGPVVGFDFRNLGALAVETLSCTVR
jgi:hypothetical protein